MSTEIRNTKTEIRKSETEDGILVECGTEARPYPASLLCAGLLTAHDPARLGTADATPARRREGRGGFTLVELLLVLVILGTLAAIVLPKFSGVSQRGRITAAATQISTFKTALDAFEVDMGYYPRGRNGLLDLIVQPRNAPNWHGPYLQSDSIPKDPWGNDYLYECPGKHNPSFYDVSSAGPDGKFGTDDDICNWTIRR